MIIDYSLTSVATFLLVLFFHLTTGHTCGATTTVLDIKGRPLRAKSRYYILPAVTEQGGGLAVSPRNRSSCCPLYVAQKSQELDCGLAVWFLPADSSQRLIALSSDLNIVFNAFNNCLQSAGWQLIADQTTRRKYVATGGAIGNPGEETLNSWFSIEKVGRRGNVYDNNYKIVFCPTVCPSCMVRCGHVGVFVQEDGSRLLGLTDLPLPVMFKKARRRSSSSSSS